MSDQDSSKMSYQDKINWLLYDLADNLHLAFRLLCSPYPDGEYRKIRDNAIDGRLSKLLNLLNSECKNDNKDPDEIKWQFIPISNIDLAAVLRPVIKYQLKDIFTALKNNSFSDDDIIFVSDHVDKIRKRLGLINDEC